MKFILGGLGNFSNSWKLAERAATIADDLGFYGLVLPDHYMWDRNEMPDRNSTLDCWIALTFLAAKTRKLMLGTLVTPIPLRPPGILAKMVATLDIVSSGRAVLGVGAGWSRTEFEGYSEWNDSKTRVDKTEEGVQLIRKLWQDEVVDFQGRFYKAKAAVLEPKPVQKPYPPLLFGGFSPRMLRLAGRYGDLCFIPPWIQIPFDRAKSKAETEAKRAGRPGELSFGAGSPTSLGGKFDVRALEKDIQASANKGCEFYITPFPQDDYVEKMKEFARDILPSYNDPTRIVTKAPSSH